MPPDAPPPSAEPRPDCAGQTLRLVCAAWRGSVSKCRRRPSSTNIRCGNRNFGKGGLHDPSRLDELDHVSGRVEEGELVVAGRKAALARVFDSADDEFLFCINEGRDFNLQRAVAFALDEAFDLVESEDEVFGAVGGTNAGA